MKLGERLLAVHNRLSNRILGRVPLFKDTVLAISNLTRTLNDLVRAYTQLAKMVIEDRDAINDLYALHAELQDDRLRALGASATQKVSAPQRPSDPSRINTDWAESDKKKMSN